MSIACVKITHLPLQCEVARRSDLRSRIVIIYHGEESRPIVLDASPNARLRRGISLIRAMSQFPEATVIRADESFYDARWHEVIESLLKVSDRVEDAARGIAFVDIDGLSELYGGQDQIVTLISEATTKYGLDALIGVAPGRFPAYCAAIRTQPVQPDTTAQQSRCSKKVPGPYASRFIATRKPRYRPDARLRTRYDGRSGGAVRFGFAGATRTRRAARLGTDERH